MTRIAAIGDTHGNAYALEAVLHDVRRESPDLCVNLGDQVTGRADPARAYRLQTELNATCILGSAEPALQDDDPLNRWLRDQLPEGAVARLTNPPVTAALAGGAVLACHGDLRDPRGHLLWSWQRGPYLTRSATALRSALEDVTARVVLCGHTHREGMTALEDWLVVNVGAVGLQVDGDPRARWALLEECRGRWTVDFRRVPYDQNAAAAWAGLHAPDPLEEAGQIRCGR